MNTELPHMQLMDDDLINDLKKIIFSLYNGGQSVDLENGAIGAMIRKKYNDVDTNNQPENWVNLTNELKTVFKLFPATDENHYNFPSKSFRIQLLDETQRGIRYAVALRLKVSLLCNYFTLFYENIFFFNDLIYVSSQHRPTMETIISGQQRFVDPEGLHFKHAIELISNNYPNFTYVDSATSFGYHIENTMPIGGIEQSNMRYPIFAYLFGSDYLYEKLQLAK